MPTGIPYLGYKLALPIETQKKHVLLAVARAKLKARERDTRNGHQTTWANGEPAANPTQALHDPLKMRLELYGYLKPSLTGIFATYYDSFKAGPDAE